MTLIEAGEVFRYWEQNPPVHLLMQVIARLLGWRPTPPISARPDFRALAASPPPGLAVIRGAGLADMPAPMLDPAALADRNRARAVAIARRNPEVTHG